jgi:hypothetical protein
MSIDAKVYILIHNYDSPLMVKIIDNNVDVYTHTEALDNYLDDYAQLDKYSTLVKSYKKVKKIFLGVDEHKVIHPYSKPRCNTILLNTSGLEYAFIGNVGYKFKAKEEIVKFISPVGPNEIPYPFAITENYIYMILDKMYIEKYYFDKDDDWLDLYSAFYDKNLQKYGTYIDKRKKNKLEDHEDTYEVTFKMELIGKDFKETQDIYNLFEPLSPYGSIAQSDWFHGGDKFYIGFDIKKSKTLLFHKKVTKLFAKNDSLIDFSIKFHTS